jgi:hypothetical protein
MKLNVLVELFSVCRMEATSSIPEWAMKGSFYSLTKTSEELSIVCEQKNVPTNIKQESNWRAMKVVGPLDFSLTGILASLAQPLAQAKISIFAISTFDTDFILVREANLLDAMKILSLAGHETNVTQADFLNN